MFCINIKCMYPQYPSIFLNLYSTLILCEYLWLGWINSSYIYIYTSSQSLAASVLFFMLLFPRKLTRLGNPCWLKGIPTFSIKPYFFFPPWPWIFPRKVSSNPSAEYTNKAQGLFFGPKIGPWPTPPPSEWNEGINKLILLTALHGLEESVPFCDYMVIYWWWLEEIRLTSWSW